MISIILKEVWLEVSLLQLTFQLMAFIKAAFRSNLKDPAYAGSLAWLGATSGGDKVIGDTCGFPSQVKEPTMSGQQVCDGYCCINGTVSPPFAIKLHGSQVLGRRTFRSLYTHHDDDGLVYLILMWNQHSV